MPAPMPNTFYVNILAELKKSRDTIYRVPTVNLRPSPRGAVFAIFDGHTHFLQLVSNFI